MLAARFSFAYSAFSFFHDCFCVINGFALMRFTHQVKYMEILRCSINANVINIVILSCVKIATLNIKT